MLPMRMMRPRPSDSKPWTLEAYVAAIQKLAVDMHDDTFIKATVSVQAVLDDDPRTLRLLEIL